MNRAKISAGILVLVSVLAVLAPIIYLSNTFKPVSQPEELPSFIVTDTASTKNLVVWQTNHNTTAVNSTESWWLVFTKLTYNATSMNITSQIIDAWRLNYTSNFITESLNTSSVINYALNACSSYGNAIKISAGNYTIDRTLSINGGTTLYGEGSVFQVSPDFKGDCLVRVDGSNVSLRDLHVDMTNTTWNGVGYSFPYLDKTD